MISDEEIKHIAKLARLGISRDEVLKFSKQLSNILNYVDQLKKVDTKNVEPTSQVTGLKNVSRKDKVDSFCDKYELLSCTELPLERGQIKVKSVITEL
jgi:aspartyl-tRNA(Asn)/glutamyl-tRNA(Gln) amidotransferase subunit C